MQTLGIFVKEPTPGRVKTRLAQALDAEAAAALYTAFLHDIINKHRTVADRRVLCYSPDTTRSREYFSDLSRGDFELWAQPDASLGDRMREFFETFTENHPNETVLVGSDSPTLPTEYVFEAFEALRQCDIVLGPATDGGYYLIGQRRFASTVFDQIGWSGSRVFVETVERVMAENLRLKVLPAWYDVDCEDDLNLLRGHMLAWHHAGELTSLPETWRYLFGDAPRTANSL